LISAQFQVSVPNPPNDGGEIALSFFVKEDGQIGALPPMERSHP
jgi:hypothetical protein